MRAVVQRVTKGKVSVDGTCVGSVGSGLVVLVGVGREDDAKDAAALADKVVGLRIFEDDAGKMNRSVQEIGGGILAVSQFTLFGDVRKGRRPSFGEAMEPEQAKALFNAFCETCRSRGVAVETGRFREHMVVELSNDGPVTILIDSKRGF
jgi:D-tyrosyl-tRNA(Tyr) deacylase